MILRALLLLSLLVTGIGSASGGHSSAGVIQSADLRVMHSASISLRTHSRAAVLRWLRAQPEVAAALLGMDHKTIEIHYRDGATSMIVPRTIGPVSLAGLPRPPAAPRAFPRQTFRAHALILQPFADCSGPCNSGGPDAADPEIGVLQRAGYQVDDVLDQQVTVQVMSKLSNYNVVFMFTHSGVSGSGGAIIVTGQLQTQTDATTQAYQADGSLTASEIDGDPTNTVYWAITTHFVLQHTGTFPAHALEYISGCNIQGTDLWSGGFKPKGAGALIGWDQEAAEQDGFLTAYAFFNFMGQGQSAAQALSSTLSEGLGVSKPPNAAQATLTLLGDGTITLAEAASSGSPGGGAPPVTVTGTPVTFPAVPSSTTTLPPPPPVPGSGTQTPVSSPAVPTGTATVAPAAPTATATAAPPTPTATTGSPTPPITMTLTARVNPGESQQITVNNFAPSSDLQLLVTFPNGDIVGQRQTADSTGSAQFTFKQPGSKITRTNSMATVAVTGQEGAADPAAGSASVTAKYAIGFGRVDVTVDPRTQTPGQKVSVFVHTRAATPVAITVRTSKSKLTTLKGVTGQGGWTHLTYAVPKSVDSGRLLVVRAWVKLGGKLIMALTTFKVK